MCCRLERTEHRSAPGQLGERGNQTYQYTLRYKGRLQQTTEFENIVIKALENGEILRLKDVSNVELGRHVIRIQHMVNGHKSRELYHFPDGRQ